MAAISRLSKAKIEAVRKLFAEIIQEAEKTYQALTPWADNYYAQVARAELKLAQKFAEECETILLELRNTAAKAYNNAALNQAARKVVGDFRLGAKMAARNVIAAMNMLPDTPETAKIGAKFGPLWARLLAVDDALLDLVDNLETGKVTYGGERRSASRKITQAEDQAGSRQRNPGDVLAMQRALAKLRAGQPVRVTSQNGNPFDIVPRDYFRNVYGLEGRGHWYYAIVPVGRKKPVGTLLNSEIEEYLATVFGVIVKSRKATGTSAMTPQQRAALVRLAERQRHYSAQLAGTEPRNSLPSTFDGLDSDIAWHIASAYAKLSQGANLDSVLSETSQKIRQSVQSFNQQRDALARRVGRRYNPATGTQNPRLQQVWADHGQDKLMHIRQMYQQIMGRKSTKAPVHGTPGYQPQPITTASQAALYGWQTGFRWHFRRGDKDQRWSRESPIWQSGRNLPTIPTMAEVQTEIDTELSKKAGVYYGQVPKFPEFLTQGQLNNVVMAAARKVGFAVGIHKVFGKPTGRPPLPKEIAAYGAQKANAINERIQNTLNERRRAAQEAAEREAQKPKRKPRAQGPVAAAEQTLIQSIQADPEKATTTYRNATARLAQLRRQRGKVGLPGSTSQNARKLDGQIAEQEKQVNYLDDLLRRAGVH